MMRFTMVSECVQRRFEERLDRADAAVDSDEWLVIRELARDVLDLDPENVDAAGLLEMAERRPASLPYGSLPDRHLPRGGEDGVARSPQSYLPGEQLPRGGGEEQRPHPQPSPEMGEGARASQDSAGGRRLRVGGRD